MTGTYNTKVRGLFLAALMVLSVVVGSVALTGAAAAAANETLNDGSTYFQGQTLVYTNGVDTPDETFVIETEDGAFVRQVSANSGTLTIDSTELAVGQYVLASEYDSTPTGLNFRIANQTLDLSSEVSSVSYQGSADITVDSNRADYTHHLTATLDGSNVEPADLKAILDGVGTVTQNADGDDVLAVSGSDSQTLTLDLSGTTYSGELVITSNVADTTASDSITLDLKAKGDADAEFNSSVVRETRGDVAEIVVDLKNTDTAYVTIGTDDVNYKSTVEVVDGDDDGQVTLLLNTYATDDGFQAYSVADGDDDVINVSAASTPAGRPLASTDYDLSLSLDAAGNQETDVGTLVVTDGGISTFGMLTAPDSSNVDDFESISDVYNVSVSDNSIAQDDLAIARLGGSGVFGAIEAQSGSSAELKFLNLLGTNSHESSAFALSIKKADNSPNADAPENLVNTSLTSSNFNVVYDEDKNAAFIVLDTDTLETGQYNVEFTVGKESGLTDEDGSVDTVFHVVERTAEFDTQEINDTDTVVVSAQENATVTGESSVAPGTELTVVVKSTGDSPFLLDETVEVQEDGTFNATFDFSDVSANTEFETTVSGYGGSVTNPGIVQPAPTSSVSVSDQTNDGSYVIVDSVTLTEGGFVTIHDASLLDGKTFESVRGTSGYLEAGTHSNVNVSLDTPYEASGEVIAMPHLDTNGNQVYDFVTSDGSADGPYTADGSAVTDSATLTVENESAGTPKNNTTNDGGEGDGKDETDDDKDKTDDGKDDKKNDTTDEPKKGEDDTTPAEGPGFGVAAALVALVAAALIALRRD
ncbi:DUF7282 domain-containing protein [Halomarina pelagica]|uniref:DUF7282 domain-containing protein n=1 Tax=Halomarina pelagica TaxID=2961599 RepID=UPI0020C40BA2|nr:BGTF surface domain-containing protein [Halomarina sp. BND7]